MRTRWIECLSVLVLAVAVLSVREVRALDGIQDIAGTPKQGGFKGDGGAATGALLNAPLTLTHDAAGNIYFSDISNQRVRRIDAATGVITTVAGNGTSGFSGDNGPATSAQLNSPVGLAVDAAGNLYVADQSNNRIRKIDTSGIITTICGTGSGTSGPDGAAATTTIATPGSMAYDPSGAGAIVFGELNGFRVRRIDLGTLQATTYVGTGVNGFFGDTGPATSAQIGTMSGMAFDAAGNFYLVDSQNARIRKRDTSGNINTIAGNGSQSFGGDGGPPLSASFNLYTPGTPTGGVVVDAAGNIYVTDTLNQRIRKIGTNNVVSTVCGIGIAGYNGSNMDASVAQVSASEGVDLVNGRLVFADTGNQLIRAIGFNTAPVTISALNVTDANGNAVSTIQTGTALTFTASASNTSNLPMTFTWDFGDGSVPAMGNPVTHTYTIENTFLVKLTASDGGLSATQTASIQTFAPNSGGQGVPNLSQGLTEIINPINLLGISVLNSNGGVIQLSIDTGNLRAAANVSTDFLGIGGRSATAVGPVPVFKVTTPGIFVGAATATTGTNPPKKGRKTIAVGSAEIGSPPAISAMPKSQSLAKLTMSGKFSFTASSSQTLVPLAKTATDSVAFSGVIELPAGLDLSTSQTIALGVGNLIDQVNVSAKGKALLPSTAKLVQKFQIRYPRLAKGTTRTAAGQSATIALTLSGSNFSGLGFDTEGIVGTLAAGEPAKTPASRTIQVAFVLGGVPYQVRVPVLLKLSAGGTTGTIGGRSSSGSL